MNRELSQKIVSAAPLLYRGRTKPITESLMSFGFECRDGWFQIIHDLSISIEAEAEKEGRVEENWPEAVQVKEKFATLSFYLFNSSAAIQALIIDAQRRSAVTCEQCGAPGQIYECNYIYYTACPAHVRDGSQPSGMHFV